MASGVIKDLVHYADSNSVSVTASANALARVSPGDLKVPTGAKVLSYTVITESVSGSWNVIVSFLDGISTIAFQNYGTASNTWTGHIRTAYID